MAGRILQFGDLSSRLVRALDLVGGAGQLQLEEGVLPVVLLQDATQLPFALEPRAGLGYGQATGAAGQQATLGLTLTGSGKLWIFQLIVTRTTAGPVEVNRSGRLEAGGTSTDRLMVDMSSSNAPNQGSLFLPVTIRQFTTPPVGIGTGIAASFQLAAATALVWPLDAVLGQGECLYVKNTDNATQITCAFHGRYYPTAETV
jgi:hypothetical protein